MPDEPTQQVLAANLDWILCDGDDFRHRGVINGAAEHLAALEARLQKSGYTTTSWSFDESDVKAGPGEAYTFPVDENDIKGLQTGVLHAYLPDHQGRTALATNINSLEYSPRDPDDPDAPNVGASLSASGEALIVAALEAQSRHDPIWTDAFFFSGELGHHGWAVLSYSPWKNQHGDILGLPGWDIVASVQNVGNCETSVRPNHYVSFHDGSRRAYNAIADVLDESGIEVNRERTPTKTRAFDEWGSAKEGATVAQSHGIYTYGDEAAPFVHLASPWWHEPTIEGTLRDVPSNLCWPRLEAINDLLLHAEAWKAAAAAASAS